MPSKLDQLKTMTTIVADSGDIDTIKAFKPTDCTTNPSLILKASGMAAYSRFVDEAITWGRSHRAVTSAVCDRILINFGEELTKIVPGRVSTEVDAELSFDVDALVAKARQFIADYERARRRARAHSHQARIDLGRFPGRENPPDGGHRLQHDAAVLAGAGGRLRRMSARSWSRPSSAASSTGTRRRPARISRRGRSGRPVRPHDLRLLQEARRQDGRDGRVLPQHWRDRGTRGLRPADDRARTSEEACRG